MAAVGGAGAAGTSPPGPSVITGTTSQALAVQAALRATEAEAVELWISHLSPGGGPPVGGSPPAVAAAGAGDPREAVDEGTAGTWSGTGPEPTEVETFSSDVCGWGFHVRTRRQRAPTRRAAPRRGAAP